jgi:hypothetical protein
MKDKKMKKNKTEGFIFTMIDGKYLGSKNGYEWFSWHQIVLGLLDNPYLDIKS